MARADGCKSMCMWGGGGGCGGGGVGRVVMVCLSVKE